MGTKMWSYKLVWDTMFAPNPLFEVLTLATCKPVIRKSKKTDEGTWIAGWTACKTHTSPAFGGGILHYERNKEKLIYLARVDEILSFEEYWDKFPVKHFLKGVSDNNPRYYGDNIYYKNEAGKVMQDENPHHDEKCIIRDTKGQKVLICREFYYFTPNKRLDVTSDYQDLVHPGIGQRLIESEKVTKFIQFVREKAHEIGIKNGIIGELPFQSITSFATQVSTKKIKGGCSK